MGTLIIGLVFVSLVKWSLYQGGVGIYCGHWGMIELYKKTKTGQPKGVVINKVVRSSGRSHANVPLYKREFCLGQLE